MNNLLAIQEVSDAVIGDYDRLIASLQSLSPQESIRLLKQFLQTYPSFAQGHNDLGVLYLRSGKPTLALAHQEKACRLKPDNITFRKNLADFYAVELGWLDDAVDIYLEILKRNPRDTEALIALGRLGSAMDGSAALEQPVAPLKIEVPPTQQLADKPTASPSQAPPVTPPAWKQPAAFSVPAPPRRSFDDLYREAQEAAGAGRMEEARRTLEELRARQPGNAVIYNDLGVVCYNLGDVKAAQAHYEDATSLNPGNAVFARNLADLYFAKMGRGDDAIRIYLDLHRRNSRDVETLVNLGHICSAVDRPAEAKNFYQRALEIEPWNNQARQAMTAIAEPISQSAPMSRRTAEDIHAEALKLAAGNRPNEALLILEELVQQYPYYAIAHNDLGVLCYQLGDSQGAGKAYEQAVKLQPRNSNFRKNLASFYFVELGRTDDAIHIYLDLFREQPRDVEILLSLGQICTSVGRPEEARSFYRRVLEIEPWNMLARQALQGLQ